MTTCSLVGWVVSCVSEDSNAFIYRVEQSKKSSHAPAVQPDLPIHAKTKAMPHCVALTLSVETIGDKSSHLDRWNSSRTAVRT
jgi:hypothetical protein